MRFLAEALAELIAPTRCAGCELPGALLCPTCDRDLPRVEPCHACSHCGAPYGALVCTECWSTEFAFEAAVALGVLDVPLSRAVVLHKDANERRLGVLLGTMLGGVVGDAWGSWPDVVTWVPPTDAALHRRGFDHAASIAKAVAAKLDRPVRPALRRTAARDQRVLSKAERARNAAGTFRLLDGAFELRDARVLVVDDVLTTGATLDACAEALLSGGARAVRVAVVARAW